MSTEWETTTETIHIEDIKDPKERKKWEEVGAAHENTNKLRRINFMEAVVKESQSPASFKILMTEMEKAGFDFKSDFKKMKVLDKTEQSDFIKQRILSVANKISYL